MFFFMHFCTDTRGVNAQGHEHTRAYKHAQTRTWVHHWGSSAFNPWRLVSGGVRVRGPCPLYWSDWTWGGLPHKGLSSERRHICGEWKVNGSRKKIDRGHSGTSQGNKKNWAAWRGFRTIWTQNNVRCQINPILLCINDCRGQKTCPSTETSLIWSIMLNTFNKFNKKFNNIK